MDNDIINIIVDWGRIRLLNPKESSRLKLLEEEFNALSADCNIQALLLSEQDNIKADISKSRQILSSPTLVFSDDSQEIWYEAIQAFHAFDILNYILESFNYMPALQKDKNSELYYTLDNLRSEILDWLYCSDFSSIRLTALNKYRNERLKTIPEDKRFLYPWYELSSEYSETTIDTLIEFYDVLFSDNAVEKLPDDIKEYYFEISNELLVDKELLAEIKTRYFLDKAIKNTLSVRNALLLWRISEVKSAEFDVPIDVLSKGLVRSSIQATDNVNDELLYLIETLFLSAFCGPILDDSIKLKTLKFVEDTLFKKDVANILIHTDNATPIHPILLIIITRQQLDFEIPEENIISDLKAWYNPDTSDINDDILAQNSFSKWLNMLDLSANNLEEIQEDVAEEEFQAKVLELTERIRRNSYQILPVFITAKRQVVMGEEDEDNQEINMRFPDYLVFEIQPNETDNYRLLPLSNYPSVAGNQEYALLLKFINDAHVYGSAYGIQLDDKVSNIMPTRLIANPAGLLEVSSNIYKHIIITISGSRDKCEEASNLIIDSNYEALTKLHNVVFLIFNLVKSKE